MNQWSLPVAVMAQKTKMVDFSSVQLRSQGTDGVSSYFHRLLADVVSPGMSIDYVCILERQMHL